MKKRLRGDLRERPAKHKLLRRIFFVFFVSLWVKDGGLFIGSLEVEKRKDGIWALMGVLIPNFCDICIWTSFKVLFMIY